MDDGIVIERGLGMLIASRGFAEQQADVLARVLEALVEAEQWVTASDDNFKAAGAYIAEQLKAPVDGVMATISNGQPTVTFDSSAPTVSPSTRKRTDLCIRRTPQAPRLGPETHQRQKPCISG